MTRSYWPPREAVYRSGADDVRSAPHAKATTAPATTATRATSSSVSVHLARRLLRSRYATAPTNPVHAIWQARTMVPAPRTGTGGTTTGLQKWVARTERSRHTSPRDVADPPP